ncbi:DNA-processing protein DprA [Parachryseolinea silvisoli]|uniref:DNA-processing protein DprA n=1 Tax=Parachryseolinea silvisoli TaxID=2873601 RepID=UPI002265F1E9|nr:DNA-processing protein DprA [Parachryseolinea silvisoli]MCD9014130.1 DNA-protecting protein DprA [Parachryseolinea silvisoli]
MQLTLHDDSASPFNTRDLLREMAAYEALWARPQMTMARLAAFFARYPGQSPSSLVDPQEIARYAERLATLKLPSQRPGVLLYGTPDYPTRLRDAEHPVELLYYRGDVRLLQTRMVTVVGTRHPTPEGLARTAKLVTQLVHDGITIVSGLAAGIDAAAHRIALENNGHTVGVIGTPVNHAYPAEHAALQETIAQQHLLISPVPYWLHSQQDYKQNSKFFPERNKVSAALSEASIIVEAGDMSGTLGLGRAALYQKRKLFVLESSVSDDSLRWPKQFEAMGAIVVRSYTDIRKALQL